MTADKAIALAAVAGITAALTFGLPGWLLAESDWLGPLSSGLVAAAGLYSLSMVLLAAFYERFGRGPDAIQRANDLRSFSSLLPDGLLLALAMGLILRAALTFAPLLAS